MRKNITKLVPAAIAAVTTTAFLAGCGSSAQSTSADESRVSQGDGSNVI